MAVCSPRRLSGHRESSAHRDGGMPAPPTFRSPCRRRGLRAHFEDTACNPLVPPAVYPPRRRSGHRVSSARITGDVPTPPRFQSPRSIRLPRRRCASPADYLVTACHPRVAPAASTFRLLRVIGSPCRQCARPVDFLVSSCDPLNAMAVWPPNLLSGHSVTSALRNGPVSATLPFRSLHIINSPRRGCDRPADYTVIPLVAATAVCPPPQLSSHRVSSTRRDGCGPAPRHSGRRVLSASGAGVVPARPSLRSPRLICSPRRWCSRSADFLVAACHQLAMIVIC
jgi:hypothetical protein